MRKRKALFWLYLAILISTLAAIDQDEGGTQVKEKIALRPIGAIDKKLLVHLKEQLGPKFEAEVEVAEPMKVPGNAHNAGRGQYHSTSILDGVRQFEGAEDFDKVLGICDVDLYVPGLNFVFGEASLAEGVAIISLVRLRQGYYGLPEDDGVFMERSVKEAVHELGHLYDLTHCRDSRCVIFFSNNLMDTDRKGSTFCPRHQSQLERAMGR